MRTFRSLKARGFTLVELMIVVAIIGVLAALAIFGVRKYLATAKTAEAKNSIGAINRGAVAAYERIISPGELLKAGSLGTGTSHELCGSADPVPTAGPPKGNKYQPDTAVGKDFNGGTASAGWKCLQFSLSEAHYYQYAYTKGGTAQKATKVTIPTGANWISEAVGDLNGDGAAFSNFAAFGAIENGQPKVGTQLLEADPDE